MPLKKPAEYFKKSNPSVDYSVQELQKAPELNTFSDAFESFKSNLGKIEVLSDFTETLDNYRVNIERINHLSEKVEDIKTEIGNLLKKEDLDRAMMSQLLVVEESIREVQSKVKSINEKDLISIRTDVSQLSEAVVDFLETDVPKYKKLVVDAEIRTNNRYEELEQNVNQTLTGIGEFVDNKYDKLTETLQGINEKSLAGILQDFNSLDETVTKLKEEEIPKYKGFIVETERKTETKLEEFDEKLDKTTANINERVNDKINNLYSTIKDVETKFEELKEEEIPKYKGFIVEAERKTETKLEEFDEKLDKTVTEVLEIINSVETITTETENKIDEKLQEVDAQIELTDKLRDKIDTQINVVETYKQEISKKVTDLEIEIVRNESHIKKQNQNLEQIQEEVQVAFQRLNLEELEEKNYELTKKVKYLEEVFEKFNETQILTEDIVTETTLAEPPSSKNKDPLTPLDKNFVTLEQLQQHYRLFINRIQQQIATIGGGGETQLKYLDDIVGIATNASAYDGKFLKYNHSIQKFEFVTVAAGAGTQTLDQTLALGNSSALGMTVGVTTVTSLNVDSVANFDTNTTSFSSTTPTQIYTFSATNYRSARLQVQITQGTDFQTSDILLIHDGTTANIIEYASISTNDYLGTFDAIVSGGNASLRVLMGSSTLTTVKVASQKITL